MDTAVFVFRILFLVVGSIVGIIYFLFQLYQTLPKGKEIFSMADYVVLTILCLVFGFGTNSYYGLLAFVPALLLKLFFRWLLKPEKLKGSGRWMEIHWRKLTPKGFDRNIPKNFMDEMNKIPQDKHFLIPRFYMLILIKFISKKMNKEKNKMAPGISQSQQDMAYGQFTAIIDSVQKLSKGRMEKKDFPFGVLKITRL